MDTPQVTQPIVKIPFEKPTLEGPILREFQTPDVQPVKPTIVRETPTTNIQIPKHIVPLGTTTQPVRPTRVREIVPRVRNTPPVDLPKFKP